MCLAVESTEREPGRGEPPSPESDQPAESAEPLFTGEEHGEQRAVSPGTETIHVTPHNPTPATQTTLLTAHHEHLNLDNTYPTSH